MSVITILSSIGVILGSLCLEMILLLGLETSKGKKITKKIKNKIRHLWWTYFDYKNDFVEKD